MIQLFSSLHSTARIGPKVLIILEWMAPPTHKTEKLLKTCLMMKKISGNRIFPDVLAQLNHRHRMSFSDRRMFVCPSVSLSSVLSKETYKGFPQALGIMESLENYEKSSMHGKIMEIEKKLNNHGKIMEFVK